MNIQPITITAIPSVYDTLSLHYPKKSKEFIQTKIDDYVAELEMQIILSMAQHPAESNKFKIYAVSMKKLMDKASTFGRQPNRVYWHNEILRLCPLFKKANWDTEFGSNTWITLTTNLNVNIMTKTQLSTAINYNTGIQMKEVEANRLIRNGETNKLINELFPDLYTNLENYELVRINLQSIREYYKFITQPGFTMTNAISKHLAIIPTLISIGEYFSYKDPTKHEDYSEYGVLPVLKVKSKFGRIFYSSKMENLNPQSMDKAFRKIVLGDLTTHDYDMRAFAITWMYGVTKEFTQSKGIDIRSELPITHMIASGYRSTVLTEIAYDVFEGRLNSDKDIEAFYNSQEWKYKKTKTSIIVNGEIHCTIEHAMKLLKTAFTSIGFGATAGNKCWVKSRVVKGQTIKSFQGTALRDTFGDKELTTKFVEHPLVQQFFIEMETMTKIIMSVKKADYIHLSNDEDFCSTKGKWNPNKVMAYLYQTAEFNVMEDVRKLVAYYQDKGWWNGIVIANIHDGFILSQDASEMIREINNEIRIAHNNEFLTLVGEEYEGYSTSFFANKAKAEHERFIFEQDKQAKNINYTSPFATTTPIEVVPTMEEMLLDFYKQQEEN